MAIVQQMFPASLDGSYWFAEYRPTTDSGNGDYSYSPTTLSVDSAGFIYTSGTYYKHGTGYQGRFGREYYFFHAKHTPSGDIIFLKRRQHQDNWSTSHENSIINTNNDFIHVGHALTRRNNSGDSSQADATIWKWDKDGNYGWHRSLGNNSNDTHYDNYDDVGHDSSGNIYCVGDGSYQSDLAYNGTCTGSWGQTVLVAKYNSSGSLQWKKGIRKGTGCQNDSFYSANGSSIAVASNGNIYLCGNTNRAKSTGTSSGGTPECGYSGQGWIMKLNSSGSIQWQKRVRSNYTITHWPSSYNGCWTRIGFRKCCIDSNENVFVVGENWASSDPAIGTYANYAGILMKYNSSGTLQWQTHWHRPNGQTGGTPINLIKGLECDVDGNFYLCSSWSDQGSILINKWNSSGTHQWVKGIKRNNSDVENGAYGAPRDFRIDNVRKLMIITGTFQDSGGNRNKGFIIKLPLDGSHTGTYGNWVYSNYTQISWNHGNTFNGTNIAPNHGSGVLDIYSSGMVERQSYNTFNSQSDHPIEKSSHNNA